MDQLDGALQRIGVDTHVDIDEADIAISGILRLDAVGKTIFLTDVQAKA